MWLRVMSDFRVSLTSGFHAKASIASALFICAAFGTNVSAWAEEPVSPRVLMLHAYNYSFPATTRTAEAARQRLVDRFPKIHIDADFLDLVRASDRGRQARAAAFLAEKYADARPDLIMTIGSAALPFIIKYRETIAPNVPVVFTQISEANYADSRPPPDITGIISGFDLDKTLDLAERLQPDARRLYVVAGAARVDRLWQTRARKIIESRKRKFETTYLYELAHDDLLFNLATVPHNSIVVVLTVFVDGEGKTFVPAELAAEIARISAAPAYAPYDTFLRRGTVGGFVETFESVGRSAADMALEILAGKDPTTLPPRANPEQTYRVNYKAMRRWSLSESDLPPGTDVIFKRPSIFVEHRNLVLAVLLVFGLQTALVCALLMQQRRRRRAETLLKESEKRMAFAAASADVGLWQFEPETDQFWATDHCRALLGLQRGSLLTRDEFLLAIHPDDREAAISSLEAASNAWQSTDIRVMLPDDSTRWLRVRARCISDGSALSPRPSGTIADITDQKAAEADAVLQRQEIAHLMRVSALGELSGSIAHEINQPLTAILSSAQAALYLLGRNSPDLDEVRDALQDIVKENNRAGDVIQRLRDLLKKGRQKTERISVNNLVDSTLALLKSELIGRRMKVTTNLPESLPATTGDPIQLQQVLLNVVMNAMDAMADTPIANRLIIISTRATQKGTVEIIVQDHGHGIRPSEEDKLFSPFYSNKDHGLGLGLTICSTIVEAHGGDLTLENDRSGTGVVATLSLSAEEVLMAAQ